MLMVDLIKAKRDGGVLNKEEITFIVSEYIKGKIPDYQVSALLMAIYFKGLNKEETLDLTLAMKDSGDVLDLSGIKGVKVDKHSTGGVGDKTTLVLAPMVASIGVPVAKMSGRGLGHTGGTIDKLESIRGFRTDLGEREFIANVNNIGIALMGQTKDLAPADKKLYALRDVTATVDNMSLIASSVMSKKLAAGSDGIVLDVTCGSGAFMKNYEDAKALAEEMVSIGKMSKKKTIAVISDMNEPLGRAVGNALEVREAVNALKGQGEEDLLTLCYELGSYMVMMAGICETKEEGKERLKEAIGDGRAYDKFEEFVKAQGGDADFIDSEDFIKTSIKGDLIAEEEGYISSINCEDVGNASLLLGGGRRSKEDSIDPSVGLVLNKKLGDPVKKGESIATLYANDSCKYNEGLERLKGAFKYSERPFVKEKLIKGIVE
ncbi:MAG: pyrimidine-nucleoside phosphorylase [Lachnospiraceae bacterium]|nr:pyrimidine-nucleoside phosphorylase [Lachnospiraceae bacterium]